MKEKLPAKGYSIYKQKYLIFNLGLEFFNY